MVSDGTKGSSRVAARICARWIDCGAAPVRPSLPPMFIRQEASPATTKSAPLETTLAALSVTIASEVASFLTAKVPPKPQQEAEDRKSTRRNSSHVANSYAVFRLKTKRQSEKTR